MPEDIEAGASPDAAAAAVSTSYDAILDAWFSQWFRDSPLVRNTGDWNHAFAALQDLKRRLSAG